MRGRQQKQRRPSSSASSRSSMSSSSIASSAGGRRRPGSASSYNVRRQDARQEHVPSSSNSDAEMCLEAVRLRLRLLRSRMREVKNTADAIKLNGSELQTEVRRCCGELMRALEERQRFGMERIFVFSVKCYHELLIMKY